MGRKILAILALFAIVLAVFVGLGYRRDMAAARARISSGSQLVTTPCGPIEYADVGTGPVIFAVHGAGGGFDQSLALAKAFLAPGYRVIAPSRFGYLRTPLPADASPATQADAHACLLDALNVPRAVIVGGSMGAPSAMQLCLRHPDRCSALILLFPIAYAPRPPDEPPLHPSAFAQFLLDRGLKSDFIFWAASKLARDSMIESILATPSADFKKAAPEEQERALEILRDVMPISQRQNGLRSDAAVAPSVPRYDLERIAVPTLVIAAENDLFGTYKGGRYTADHIPGARFVGYPTGGHLLVGHGNDVRSELSRFLAMYGGQGPMTYHFDCVFYYVSDLERSIRFYRDVLGFKFLSRDVVARFDIDGVLFEVVPSAAKPKVPHAGNARLCLRVEKVEEALRDLHAKGVRTSPAQDKGTGVLGLFEDPDGNELCLWQYRVSAAPQNRGQ